MIEQPSLNLTGRDFHLIMYELLRPNGYLETKYGSDYVQFRDSELGMSILEVLAGIGDIFSNAVSAEGRETNIITAREIQRVIDMAAARGYTPRYDKSATMTATIDFGSHADPLIIEGGTQCATEDEGDGAIIFEVAYDYPKVSGQTFVSVMLNQGETYIEPIATSTGDTEDRIELSNPKIDIDSLNVVINGTSWERVDNWINSDATSRHFRLLKSEYLPGETTLTVEFGNNTYGAYPSAGATIQIAYRTTVGLDGNIPKENLVQILDPIVDLSGDEIPATVEGLSDAIGGWDAESIDDIRLNSYTPMITNSRTVSNEDYALTAKLAGGLKRATALTRNEYDNLPENTVLVLGCTELGINLTTSQASTTKTNMLNDYPTNGTSNLIVATCTFSTFTVDVILKAHTGASLISVEEEAKLIVEHMLSLDGLIGVEQAVPQWILDIGKEVHPAHIERALRVIPHVSSVQVMFNNSNDPISPNKYVLPYSSTITYSISYV